MAIVIVIVTAGKEAAAQLVAEEFRDSQGVCSRYVVANAVCTSSGVIMMTSLLDRIIFDLIWFSCLIVRLVSRNLSLPHASEAVQKPSMQTMAAGMVG